MVKRNNWFALPAMLAGFAVAAVPSHAQPRRDHSADMVLTHDGKPAGTMKIYVSALKARNENNMAGMGNTIGITRKDRKLVWVLYPQKKVYTESPLDEKYRSGEIGMDIPGVVGKEKVGQEQVLGYACTKYKLTIQTPAAGRQMTAYIWWADSLGLGLKSEIMGITSEYRNLKFGAQPDSLFEIPAGYQKTSAPPIDALGIPKGLSPETMRKLQEAMQKRAPK